MKERKLYNSEMYEKKKKITHPIINTNLHRKWLPKRRHHTIRSAF